MIVPAVSVAPIALVLAHLSRESYPALTFVTLPLISALFATVMVVLAAIAFGVWSRVVFEQVLERFDRRSLPMFVALLSSLILPPIATAFSGLYWIGHIGDGVSHRPLCWRSLSRARLYLLFH